MRRKEYSDERSINVDFRSTRRLIKDGLKDYFPKKRFPFANVCMLMK